MLHRTRELRVPFLTSQGTSKYTQFKSMGETRLSLRAETPYMALVQRVQGSIPSRGIPFVKEETDEIDAETWEDDDDDEGESKERREMEEEEVGGDGGVREEWRHLHNSTLTLTQP